MSFLSRLFGGGKLKDVLKNGAVIIDVRTPNEFDQGRAPGSINIPIDRIPVNAVRIMEMKKPIVFCCASGSRSAAAAKLMREKGLKEVYNGGSWMQVAKLLNG